MRFKLKPRIIFEAVVIVLLLLVLYIERDLGIAALITIFCIKPVLVVVSIIILLVRIRGIFPLSHVTPSRIAAPILVGIFLAVSILFANEIIFAREIIRFHLQREWFKHVGVAANYLDCERAEMYGCVQFFSYPEGAVPIPATVFRFENGIAIDVDSRQYVGYMHVANQAELPQGKSLGVWKFGCDYALGDDWYLCRSGT